jgi:hypothetical protein
MSARKSEITGWRLGVVRLLATESHIMRTALVFLLLVSVAQAQQLKSNIPYAEPVQERQVLDIYAPDGAKNLPVVLWIHGGGWQGGDKTDVQIKPHVFAERGFVFVSTNYRLLPQVDMEVLIRDVARAWAGRIGTSPSTEAIRGESSSWDIPPGRSWRPCSALILHVAGHPDVTAQAARLGAVLQKAEIPAKVFGAKETTHSKLNADLGLPDDPATQELFKFLKPLTTKR